MTQRKYERSVLDFAPVERQDYEAGKRAALRGSDEWLETVVEPVVGPDGSGATTPLLEGLARGMELKKKQSVPKEAKSE